MNVTIIIPPVVCHNLDPHTGIPFMPHMAAYLAGKLRSDDHKVQVIDSFGITSRVVEIPTNEFMFLGLSIDSIVDLLDSKTQVCLIYCRSVSEVLAVEKLIVGIKGKLPTLPVALFENTHAVTSFSLMEIADHLLGIGADVLIAGEPESRISEIVERMVDERSLEEIDGVAFTINGKVNINATAELPDNLDEIPLPAWDLFDLQGYWTAHFAHAPVKRGEKFLPLLTSRGCPFSCNFCVAPSINHRWRERSPKNVVDEMAFFQKHLGVSDYHISDLNPTVDNERIKEISHEIIRRRLKVSWKFAQGTKIETIKNDDTIHVMAKAGCCFVSFSPETGSQRLLEIMNKPFDYSHGLTMTKIMKKVGIRTQAVFLAGVPGETPEDQQKSFEYATKLLKAGLDELSVVIYAPLPGTKFSHLVNGYKQYAQCTPSPSWREDYPALVRYRMKMYWNLIWVKIRYHPIALIGSIVRIFSLKFETKMEMSLFKQGKLFLMRYLPFARRRKARSALEGGGDNQ